MFTGLIEAICSVKSFRRSGGGAMLTIDLGKLADEIKVGDSVAVNGACLTVAKLAGSFADFDISAETLAKTTLGRLTSSSQVNIERAMKAGERFGGHFVLGHIDGAAVIKSIEHQGQFAVMKFAVSPELLGQMVIKGSVAVDGVSLTIAEMDKMTFSIALIPQTLEKTTLGRAKVGDLVNIETDIIIKAVKNQLGKILPQKQPLTVEKLKEMGF
jgi:riboflavin synthase